MRRALRRYLSTAPGYRWLEAGLSQSPIQARSGPRLHPGLHKLDIEKEWLLVEDELPKELLMKEAVFDGAERDDVLVTGAEPEAEREVWDLVAAYLPLKFPEKYERIDSDRVRIRCDNYDRLVDATARTPLEAASLLAQEDFLILRDDCLVSAACVFSFGAVGRRAGNAESLDQLHRNVGGYARDLGSIVKKAVTTVDKPMWRTNWSFSLTDSLRPSVDRDFLNLEKRLNVHGDHVDEASAKEDARTKLQAAGLGNMLFCKIEFQTLRRLPLSNAVLFTVHTYVEPFHRLTPNAAKHLATSITIAQHHDIAVYKNLTDPDITNDILNYLNDVSSSRR